MRLITLDPATHYTGYAIWQEASLMQFGVMRATKSDNWDIRCLELNSKIRNLIVEMDVSACVAEYPEFQAGQRGMDAARAGDTLKLSFLCGAISCGWQLHSALYMSDRVHGVVTPEGREQPDPLVQWVRPSTWKGQLPKEVSAQRCFARYGWMAKTEIEKNASDAIMIGDWYLKKKGFEPDVVKAVAHIDL